MTGMIAGPRKQAYRLVLFQVMVVSLAALLTVAAIKMAEAYSLLLGGLVCILPNFYFARRLFARTESSSASQILKRFYANELVKISVTVILFFIVLKWFAVQIIWLFSGYVLAQVAFWIAPLVINKAWFSRLT